MDKTILFCPFLWHGGFEGFEIMQYSVGDGYRFRGMISTLREWYSVHWLRSSVIKTATPATPASIVATSERQCHRGKVNGLDGKV